MLIASGSLSAPPYGGHDAALARIVVRMVSIPMQESIITLRVLVWLMRIGTSFVTGARQRCRRSGCNFRPPWLVTPR